MSGSGLFSNQYSKKPHLLQEVGGLAAEVKDLRDDVGRVFGPISAMTVEEFTNVAIADVDAIKESVDSSDEDQLYTGDDLDGAVGVTVMSPPRNITITTTTDADIDAVDVVITGIGADGLEQTDTIKLTNGGGVTNVGTRAFSQVTSIAVPAQSGDGGSLQFGFGALIGLGQKIKSRAGKVSALYEITGNALVCPPSGTFASAAASPPYGTYTPLSAPNNTNDYAVYYEYDPTA
jgi:hypothetical protein